MIYLVLLVGCIALAFILYNISFDFDVPEPFACGGNEVCHCEESNDCIKKEYAKEK
jgi:hypothetical protein